MVRTPILGKDSHFLQGCPFWISVPILGKGILLGMGAFLMGTLITPKLKGLLIIKSPIILFYYSKCTFHIITVLLFYFYFIY